uniref:Uncharacterized protein n=1 Tax=Meloidogyne javanica TaxID=6303 RepID=A0A915M301_MELJA
MGVYFASFEYIGRQISSTNNIEGLNSWQLLLAGGGAGMLSWLANYPSDIIKTRFQADERYSNYSEVIRRIYLEGGLRAFYVGLGSTLVRGNFQEQLRKTFPANAATFFAVEWTYRLWLRRPIVSIDSTLQHEERQELELLLMELEKLIEYDNYEASALLCVNNEILQPHFIGDVQTQEDDSERNINRSGRLRTSLWNRITGRSRTNREGITSERDGVRDLWGTQIEFFLSCLGFIVGGGNTLRFPAMIFEFGGAFFIPYAIFMVIFGLPLVYMHLAIGQFSGLSANAAFHKMMPIASGLGWALVLLAVPVSIYYIFYVVWGLVYLWFALQGLMAAGGHESVWEKCQTDWLIILLLRGISLKGAYSGLLYLFTPIKDVFGTNNWRHKEEENKQPKHQDEGRQHLYSYIDPLSRGASAKSNKNISNFSSSWKKEHDDERYSRVTQQLRQWTRQAGKSTSESNLTDRPELNQQNYDEYEDTHELRESQYNVKTMSVVKYSMQKGLIQFPLHPAPQQKEIEIIETNELDKTKAFRSDDSFLFGPPPQLFQANNYKASMYPDKLELTNLSLAANTIYKKLKLIVIMREQMKLEGQLRGHNDKTIILSQLDESGYVLTGKP